MKLVRTLIVAVSLFVAVVPTGSPSATQTTPSPPTQPTSGPGGSEYPHAGSRMVVSEPGGTGYLLFLPTDDAGELIRDERLPLVIFIHGWAATDPAAYGAWIDQLVRRGAVVVYPLYQADLDFPAGTDRYLPDTRTTIGRAMGWLDENAPDALDPERVAVVGHSVGGLLAMQYALSAADDDLPVPSVLLTMMPGGCMGCGALAGALEIPGGLGGQLDPDLLAMLLTVADDPVVGPEPARRIWQTLQQLPDDQRTFLTMVGDDHGVPAIVADHNMPQTVEAGQPDSADFFGSWRLLDALMSCQFEDTDCDVAVGGSAEQLAMGAWSDGTPVRPLINSGSEWYEKAAGRSSSGFPIMVPKFESAR